MRNCQPFPRANTLVNLCMANAFTFRRVLFCEMQVSSLHLSLDHLANKRERREKDSMFIQQ